MTWLRNSQAAGALNLVTFTLTVALSAPTVAVTVADPSPAARTVPSASTLTTAGSDDANLADAVRSPVTAPPSTAATTRRWLACGPVRVTSAGNTLTTAADAGAAQQAARVRARGERCLAMSAFRCRSST